MQPIDRLQAARKRLVEQTASSSWCVSVGVERRDERLGLLLSVEKGARSKADELLRRLQLEVPARVREVGAIRLRATSPPAAREARKAGRLRHAAARRRSS
jgi:hypothetical protein